MKWDLKADRPIYAQLIEQITTALVSGEFPPGSRLPSVRDLAQEAAVNPNTMQKALAELERKQLVNTQRTAGRTVTEDTAMLEKVKAELAVGQVEQFLLQMASLGISKEQILALIEIKLKEA